MSTDVAAGRLTHVTHPLVQHKLSYLRDRETPTVHFRKLVNELTLLLTYEATKDFPTETVDIETPLETMPAERISGKKVAVCPVLRAGRRPVRLRNSTTLRPVLQVHAAQAHARAARSRLGP